MATTAEHAGLSRLRDLDCENTTEGYILNTKISMSKEQDLRASGGDSSDLHIPKKNRENRGICETQDIEFTCVTR